GDRDASLILSDMIQSYKVQESTALAEDVQRALVAELAAQGTAANDLGVKRGPFYVLVGAGMPCVLVEVAFLTHSEEGPRLAQSRYQDTISAGLLRGLRRFVENVRVAENLWAARRRHWNRCCPTRIGGSAPATSCRASRPVCFRNTRQGRRGGTSSSTTPRRWITCCAPCSRPPAAPTPNASRASINAAPSSRRAAMDA